jgi:hypothetical protein
VSTGNAQYEVDADLAGEEVLLWWGLFDHELFVEHGEKRFGPYAPVGGPIPLHHYRTYKKTRTQARADRIEALAALIQVPRSALERFPGVAPAPNPRDIPAAAFADPDPFHELTYPTALAAKRAISDYLGTPLAKLPAATLEEINSIVADTLDKKTVIARVRACIDKPGEQHRHVE